MRSFLKENKFEQMVSLLIVLTMCFLIFYLVTLSWFGESDNAGKVVTVGTVSILVTTDINFQTDILEPGKTYNKSTTIIGNAPNELSAPANQVGNAYIRVKFENSLNTSLDLNENIVIPIYDEEKWMFDEISGWYYYIGHINNATSATFNTQLKAFDGITNDYKNVPFEITLTIEAIQREYEAYNEAWQENTTTLLLWKNEIEIYESNL